MDNHALFSFEFHMPCFARAVLLADTPHAVLHEATPLFKLLFDFSTSCPHSQRQSHITLPCVSRPASPSIVSFPWTIPVQFRLRPIVLSYLQLGHITVA